MPVLDGWLKSAQRGLFGPRCLLCSAAAPLHRELCAGCLHDLPWLTTACLYCALPLATELSGGICPDCRRRPAFDRGIAAFHYAPPIDWLVTRLKFQGRLNHARLLGDLLAAHIADQSADLPDALIPVPLHPASYRRRGFNQAERIATRLAPVLRIQIRSDVLQRARDTQRQSRLPANQRAANVRQAFEATRRLDDAHIAIVDDVVTTGHTATTVARTLRAAGAARVDLYCVARA